ncbi:RISC-loading complex subunit TARBP2 isoform X4 [Camelus ferus]|uniref:RISC-loading complex subunit TARBP2 isoform X4 n=2 Tax=Camelus TaxID=9836 RepID=A0A8B8U2U3_CAMFR|nr:RISC-loading complex subunit TARBP2 isoform X4 [Camelus ferus]
MSEEEQGSGTTTGCGLPSIEQMLAANPGKTPISLLQEYGTRIGKTPVYDLLKAEGQAHQPNFTFRVTVGDTSCTGQGPSKKAAKHKAAEVALKHLKGGSMLEPALEDSSSFSPLDSSLPEDVPVFTAAAAATPVPSAVPTRSPPMEVQPPVSPQQSECNPVGALQAVALPKSWQSVMQRPKCCFECTRCLWMPGMGMRQSLMTITSPLVWAPVWMDFGTGAQAAPGILCEIRWGRRSCPSAAAPWAPWVPWALPAAVSSVSSLRSRPSMSATWILVWLVGGLRDGGAWTSASTEELSLSGLCQCLVELSTQPATVCHGSATTREAARGEAARRALQYLKIMAGSK